MEAGMSRQGQHGLHSEGAIEQPISVKCMQLTNGLQLAQGMAARTRQRASPWWRRLRRHCPAPCVGAAQRRRTDVCNAMPRCGSTSKCQESG